MNTANETALNVLETALDMCAAIRRDYPWTRSADAPSRHAHILADAAYCMTFIDCDSATALFVAGAINGEREAFAAL